MQVKTYAGPIDVMIVDNESGTLAQFANRVTIHGNGDGFEITFLQLDGSSINEETKTMDAKIVSKVFMPFGPMQYLLDDLEGLKAAVQSQTPGANDGSESGT